MLIKSLCLSMIEKHGAGIMATRKPRIEVCSPIGWNWIATGTHDLIAADLDSELLEDLLMGLAECEEYDCETCAHLD